MAEEKKTYKFVCTVCGYEVEVDTPELPEDNDDEEDVIFEDRGGEEAPMVIKKQDKGGKVIK